jgi:hypothetical protein
LRRIPTRITAAWSNREKRLYAAKSRDQAASLLVAKEHAQRSIYKAITRGGSLESVHENLDKFPDLLLSKDDFNDCLPLLSAHCHRRVIFESLIDRIIETAKQDSFKGLVDELIKRRHFQAAAYADQKGLVINDLDSVSRSLNSYTSKKNPSWQYLVEAVKAKDNLPDVLLDETPAQA